MKLPLTLPVKEGAAASSTGALVAVERAPNGAHIKVYAGCFEVHGGYSRVISVN